MTRVTIALPDELAQAVKAAGGENISAFFAKLAQKEVLRLAVRAEIEHDRRHPEDQAWRAERARETEASGAA
ncbi:MAG: hypothetical protein WCA46_05780 [Actinocatenispora sp.]